QEPTTPYPKPERFIHLTKNKKKRRNPFITVKDRVHKVKYPPFKKLFEYLFIYNPFSNLPFPMADDQPIRGNNRAVAPIQGAAIVAIDLGDNFTIKGHHISMIKDQKFDGRVRADPQKHIAEFVEIFRMFRYGITNVDAIKLKLFPSSLVGDAKVWFNELSPGVIATWEDMRQAFVKRFFPPAMFDRLMGEI
nr:reverse transcriptase domain-containing protein [Tanacetum cinerariifolium]